MENAKVMIPKPGEVFKVAGIEFIALDEVNGGLLAVTKDVSCEMKFCDKSMEWKDGSNDWRISPIRTYLNTEFAEKLGKDNLIEFESDLTSDDGMDDYGKCTDKVFLLSCDLYRKYRKLIPLRDDYVWTLTPWTCSAGTANGVRTCTPSGAVDNYYALTAIGVAPACVFNLGIFECASTEAVKTNNATILEYEDLKESLQMISKSLSSLRDMLQEIREAVL